MTLCWIITLQWNSTRGTAFATRNGTLPVPGEGMTRTDAYSAILTMVRHSIGPEASNAATLFFSLEPDALPAPVPEPARTAGGAS
jgi:hypothetical protein